MLPNNILTIIRTNFPRATDISFDWSKTLAIANSREKFADPKNSRKARLACLYVNTLRLLRTLKAHGYRLHIVSNTSMDLRKFAKAVHDMIPNTFDTIVVDNDSCTKPQPCMVDHLRRKRYVHVGNNIVQDNYPNSIIIGRETIRKINVATGSSREKALTSLPS